MASATNATLGNFTPNVPQCSRQLDPTLRKAEPSRWVTGFNSVTSNEGYQRSSGGMIADVAHLRVPQRRTFLELPAWDEGCFNGYKQDWLANVTPGQPMIGPVSCVRAPNTTLAAYQYNLPAFY